MKHLTEKENFAMLSREILREKIKANLLIELAQFEDHEGHYTRQNYTEPFWLGYVKALKDTIEIVEQT
jgi:hypothetical protein